MQQLLTAATFLFVPGDRPERFDKAVAAGADVVVIDLEDAVSPHNKDTAREAIAAWLGSGHRAAIRINAADTGWHADDAALARRFQAPVLLAKTETAAQATALGDATGTPVVALMETARAISSAQAIADAAPVVRLAFGSLDFAADIGVDPGDHEALLFARSTLVAASAAAGIGSPIDGVTTALRDDQALSADVRYAARIGLHAKLCIHPTQVSTVHRCLAPTPDDIEWARSIVVAASGGPGALAVGGHMVDPPVVARAERILAAADRPARER